MKLNAVLLLFIKRLVNLLPELGYDGWFRFIVIGKVVGCEYNTTQYSREYKAFIDLFIDSLYRLVTSS